MTFRTLELSAYDGQPLQLYEFSRASGDSIFYWRYNGSDRDITYSSDLYKAVSISDAGATFSADQLSSDLIVTMPPVEDFPQQYRLEGTIPSDTIMLRIRRAHAFDIADIETAPVATEAPLVWVGTVSGVKHTTEVQAEITCAMMTASLQRPGLRQGYQISCPHILYAPTTCKADPAAFAAGPITVVGLAGSRVTTDLLGGYASGYFTGGYIEYLTPAGFQERRFLTQHAGNVVTTMGFPAGLAVGRTLFAYPGCNRTTNHCEFKFFNLPNYGGFPHTPGRNPFDGMPLF